MTLLSCLVLQPRDGTPSSQSTRCELKAEVHNISRNAFDELVQLADSNHVIVRGLEVLLKLLLEARDEARTAWVQGALETERARIKKAVATLRQVCDAFDDEDYDVAVIKSLDHWPDLGSDLDMYSDVNPAKIKKLMKERFRAEIAPRSWGDRLACKWNFTIPGLPEAVEIHMGRLGQTGEQALIATGVARRSRLLQFGDHVFRVPSASDRLMISTLQRMYRHFYFRLCDIVDSAALLESGEVDFQDLRDSATRAGIWPGVATYLVIVSDYAREYRGTGLSLPQFVLDSARFGASEVHYGRGFLRVPIMPQSAKLYGTQLASLLRKRELHNSARLSLLPWLATAAAVGQKLTGSDKGIW